MFCDSNPWVFAIIDLNQHAFSVLKGVTPTFSNFGTLLKIDIKNCPLLGKLLSVWRTVSVLPKSAQSAQTVENSHSFFNVSYTWYKSLVLPYIGSHIRSKILVLQRNVSNLLFSFICSREDIDLIKTYLKRYNNSKY